METPLAEVAHRTRLRRAPACHLRRMRLRMPLAPARQRHVPASLPRRIPARPCHRRTSPLPMRLRLAPMRLRLVCMRRRLAPMRLRLVCMRRRRRGITMRRPGSSIRDGTTSANVTS